MTQKAYDDLGNEVFPVLIQTIAPIAFADEARNISAEFLQLYGGEDTAASMLPIQLRPIGTITATHVYCVRSSWTNELNNQLAFLSNREEVWISGNLETNSVNILSKFCTFDASLESLDLEVI